MQWVRRIAEPRVVDAILVAGCLALTGLAAKTPWSPLPTAVIVVAGALGSAVQWWRRSRPQLATAAGAVAYALSGNPGPLLVGLYSGAAYAPRRRVWALGVLGAGGIAAYSWIDAGRLTLPDAAWAVVAATAAGTYNRVGTCPDRRDHGGIAGSSLRPRAGRDRRASPGGLSLAGDTAGRGRVNSLKEIRTAGVGRGAPVRDHEEIEQRLPDLLVVVDDVNDRFGG